MTVFTVAAWLQNSNSFHHCNCYASGSSHAPSQALDLTTNIPWGRGNPLDTEVPHPTIPVKQSSKDMKIQLITVTSSKQNFRTCWNIALSLPAHFLVGGQISQLCSYHCEIVPTDQSPCLAMSCQIGMTLDFIRTWRGCFYNLLSIWKISSIFAKISCGRTGKGWGGVEGETCDSSVSLSHFWQL